MYCIDTNIIIEIFRGNERVRDKIREISYTGKQIFITAITLCELFRGAYGHANKEDKIKEVEDFASNYELLDLDFSSSKEFGKTYKIMEKEGAFINEFDLMIASIAKANNLVLVTKDKKHFKDMGVKLEEW